MNWHDGSPKAAFLWSVSQYRREVIADPSVRVVRRHPLHTKRLPEKGVLVTSWLQSVDSCRHWWDHCCRTSDGSVFLVCRKRRGRVTYAVAREVTANEYKERSND